MNGLAAVARGADRDVGAFLLNLSDRLRGVEDPNDLLAEAAAALGAYLGVSRAGYAEVEPDGEHFVIERDWTDGSVKLGTGRRTISSFGPDVTAMLRRGQTQRIEDARADPRVRAADRAAFEEMSIEAAVTVPLVKGGRLVAMFSLHKSSPRAWTDDEVRLIEEVAERTWAAHERAKTAARLRDSEGNFAFLLALSDRTRHETDTGKILQATAEMLGKHLGVARVTYGEVDEAHDIVIGKHAWANGLPAELRRHPLTLFGEALLAFHRTGATFASEDTSADPLMSAEARAVAKASGARATITVPLVKSGSIIAFLSVQDTCVRRWRDGEVKLVEEVAERTWATLERAKSAARLAEREATAAFLLELGDRIRSRTQAVDVLRDAVEAIGRRLTAHRVGYAETDAAADVLTVDVEWGDGTLAPISGRYPLASFGRYHLAALRRGETARIDDIADSPHVDADNRSAMEAMGIRAAITVPLVRRGELVALLSAHHGEPRVWSKAEVHLVEEVAERTWATVERARAEAELRRSEERLRLAVEGARLGTWAWDMKALRGWWSPRTYEIFGIAPDEEVVGQHLDMVHPDDREHVFDEIQKAMKEGREFALDYRIVRPDGTPRWVSSRGVADRGSGERPTSMTGVILDIHEHKAAEEKLRESQALLAAFMENAPVGMYLKDEAGRYVMANGFMDRVFARPAVDAIGRTADELFDGPVRDKIAHQDAIALAEGRAQVAEQHMPGTEDGSWTLVIRFPIDAGSHGRRIGGFAIDMTEQKRAEAELAASREALYQSEKLTALGSLLAGVSHELNNPLSVVVAQSVMMEEDAVGTRLASRAAKIRSAAERCAKIVATFLALARQKPPERSRVDLNVVVRGALDLTAYGLRSTGVQVECDLAESLPPLRADADQLHQVIANLVINAQQALQEINGDRRLSVATRVGRQRGTVEIEVCDNGPGIPEAIRSRVLEPFFTTKAHGAGTGLGLSYSHGVIEAHGGALEIIDAPRGAVFRITLPACPAEQAPSAVAAVAAPISAEPRGYALVVDDEAEIADTLAEILEAQGYRVRIAPGGADAKRQLASRDFDLILSDLRMPHVDGPALFAWIAAERPHLLDRIGFITGDTMGPNAVRFLAATGRPSLEKPFTPQGVRDFVHLLRTDPVLA